MNFLKSILPRTSSSLIRSKWLYQSNRSKSNPCKLKVPPTQDMKASELPNGLRIVTQQIPSYITCMAFYVAVGPRYEPTALNGMSHFIEHLAYKGFRSLPQSKLEEFVAETGTKFDVKTYRDYQVFRAFFTDPRDAAFIFCILSKIITDLELTKEDIQCEKYNICLKMVEKDHNPRSVMFDYLYQTAFQGTSLAQSVVGTTDNLRSFDDNIAACYIHEKYVPGSIVVACVGRVEHDDMVRFAESRLGQMLPTECNPDDVQYQCRYTGSLISYRDDSMHYAHVAMAVEAPGYNSPDYLPMVVAKNSMGKWTRGMGGKEYNAFDLAKYVAEDNTCFSYRPFYFAHCDVGLWGIYFVTDQFNVQNMGELSQFEWQKMYAVLGEPEFERAKHWTTRKIGRQNSSVPGIVNDIGIQVLQTGQIIPYTEKIKIIKDLSLKSFKNITGKYFEDKCPVVSAIGPIEDLSEYNRSRSMMYWAKL